MMKYINFIMAIIFIALLSACEDEDEHGDHLGSVSIMFDNFAGEDDLTLEDYGSTDFNLENANNQSFNISLVRYYISEIRLSGENGEEFVDEVISTADDSKGFYHVYEDINGTSGNTISLSDIPAGNYNKITFTLGISGDIVEEGALGGVLDLNGDAWFWNWNAGYVSLAIEGNSPIAGSEDNIMRFHIGGWNEPNNIKEITLDLSVPLQVTEGSSSLAHLSVDVLKVFKGHQNVDFTQVFIVHSPSAGEHIAHNLESAFAIHHINNSYEGSHAHE